MFLESFGHETRNPWIIFDAEKPHRRIFPDLRGEWHLLHGESRFSGLRLKC